MSDILDMTAVELAAAIKAGKTTAVEATDLLWNAHEQSEKLYYWSSNLRGAAAMWCYTGFGSTAAELIQASGNKDSRYYRFAIAF